MNVTNFFSSGNYIYLPNKANPRVILAVDKPNITRLSYELYNPFSLKAKLFKALSMQLLIRLPFFSKKISFVNKKKSHLLSYVEKKVGFKLRSSVYIATAKDKVVLQLQSYEKDAVIGYMKFPLTKEGEKRLTNEIEAIKTLYKTSIRIDTILIDHYKSTPFFISKPLDGKHTILEKHTVHKILENFIRNESFYIKEHPRIKSLKNEAVLLSQDHLINIIKDITNKSNRKYKLVYEHGDFAPWNIIEAPNGNHTPFDYEHFVKDGLENFDLIKYYYQQGKLLKKLSLNKLLNHIETNCLIPEFELLFKLFLIKEIIQGIKENTLTEFETNLLKHMENK